MFCSLRCVSMLAAFAALLLFGCNQNAGPIPLEEFGARVADVLCPRIYECCDRGELDSIYTLQRDECHSLIASRRGIAAGDAVALNRVRYDADAARECVDSLAARGCGALDSGTIPAGADDPCKRIMIPLIEDGGVCSYRTGFGECTSGVCLGDRCIPSASDGEACDGVRVPCRPRSSCVSGVCASRESQVGQECEHGGDCFSTFCDPSGHCELPDPLCPAPLPTEPTSPSDGFVARQAVALCGRVFACCDPSVGGELFGHGRPAEEHCVYAWTQRHEVASDRMSIAIRSGNARWEQSRADECIAFIDALECSEIQTFFELPNVCDRLTTPLRGIGEECRYGEYDCESRYCRHGFCEEAPGLGAVCPGQCWSDDLRCSYDGACTPPLADGEDCMFASECESGSCEGFQCVPLVAVCAP